MSIFWVRICQGERSYKSATLISFWQTTYAASTRAFNALLAGGSAVIEWPSLSKLRRGSQPRAILSRSWNFYASTTSLQSLPLRDIRGVSFRVSDTTTLTLTSWRYLVYSDHHLMSSRSWDTSIQTLMTPIVECCMRSLANVSQKMHTGIPPMKNSRVKLNKSKMTKTMTLRWRKIKDFYR